MSAKKGGKITGIRRWLPGFLAFAEQASEFAVRAAACYANALAVPALGLASFRFSGHMLAHPRGLDPARINRSRTRERACSSGSPSSHPLMGF
jgi:hypothetical protein